MKDSIAPGFLIAAPQLLDPNFQRAVVFLLEQGEAGAMGVVLNRESPILLRDLCGDHRIDYTGSPEKRVRFGGPVQPEQGLVIFKSPQEDPEGRIVFDSLQVSASSTTLSRLCAEADANFHCFTGYAGWGPGQLERELADGSWILVPADSGLIMEASPEDMWNAALAINGIDPLSLVPGGGAEA